MDSKSWAKYLVGEFRKRNSGGLWLNCRALQIADELDARIDKPELIHQNNTPFCGYTAIVYSAATRSPHEYVWYVISLYESGIAYFGLSNASKITVSPSAKVRNARLPFFRDAITGAVTTMPQADWIAIASLREYLANKIWTLGESVPIFGPLIRKIHGGATAGEIKDSLLKLGCSAAYDQSSSLACKDMGNLKAASGHFQAGRIVILFINSELLKNPSSEPGFVTRGNHWVGLADKVSTSPGDDWVSTKVFSWGDMYELAPGAMMHSKDFLKWYHGYVVGIL